MPMYSFKCRFCGARHGWVLRSIETRDDKEICEKCQEPMDREITTPAVKPFTPYYHHTLGREFSSYSEERKYAKENGLVNISGDFGKHYSWKDSKRGEKLAEHRNKTRSSKRIVIS